MSGKEATDLEEGAKSQEWKYRAPGLAWDPGIPSYGLTLCAVVLAPDSSFLTNLISFGFIYLFIFLFIVTVP